MNRPSTLYKSFFFCVALLFSFLAAQTQTVLVDHHFQSISLPAGVTSDGVISPTKAADGVCTQGMIQVNSGGFLQVDVSSCGVMTLNMKSTSSSTRLLTIRYKKDGDAGYTVATTSLAVSTAATFNLTTLHPDIVSPVPVSVRIEPMNGNIQVHDLYVQASATMSSAAEITAFKIAGQIGTEVINSSAGTVNIDVPLGTPLTSVVPQSVTLSSQASVNPSATAAQNFTSPVTYTVTAQSGATKSWTVTVTPVASAAKEITGFRLNNQQLGDALINSAAGTVAVTMPVGTPLSSIVPQSLLVSANASITPTATTARDFSSPVVYTVTAQDNSTKSWTITTNVVDPNTTYFDYEAEAASFTGTVDNNHLNYTGTGFINFLSNGDNFITFTTCQRQAGPQTAKFRYSLASDSARKGKLYVNDTFIKLLDFARTTTYDDWNEEITPVDLIAGVNNIRITWDSTDGPNLDKMLLTGASCNSYLLNISSSNGGSITVSPARATKKYFDGENVTLLANSQPALTFNNWSGDITGTTNPVSFAMNSDKTIVGNFTVVPTYKLAVTVNGIGDVVLSPAGAEYASGTVVTLTANSVLGSTFTGWSGDATGSNTTTTVTMNSAKAVIATFTSSYTFNFEEVKGFASIAGDGFAGPTKGGQCAPDTVLINGPSEFNKLCETLYNRQQAYRNNTTVGGMKKAPLVILLKAGIYDGSQTLSTNGAKVFANSMLDIPEQAELSFVGQSNVVFKIGINVKRSYNVLIRNITFQDYYDDGVNIGGDLTHHIWVDHCTFGNPSAKPADSEHPDGGCDVKDGASYVTISWCVFRNNWKTSLVGHSDNNGAVDAGRLKVTYINNHFIGNNSRNPRVRFGEVHFVNNLVQNISLYGSVAANGAYLFSENNFFLNTDWPMYADRTSADFKAVFGNNSDGVYTSKTGNYPALGLKQVGNGYDDSGLPVITAQINPAMLNPGGRSVKFDELNPSAVFTPSSYYPYTPLAAAEVRTINPIYAGADKVQFTSNCSTVLPLQLLSFDVKLDASSKKATASWTTTNEVNMASFQIEKSINGKDFSAIARITATNLNGSQHYSSVDGDVATGLSYYRLLQLDRDGKSVYSRVVTINNKSKQTLAVYPNPVTTTLQVTHATAVKGAMLSIISAEGKTIKTCWPVHGSTVTSASVADLSRGSYMVVFHNGTGKSISKFVKQ
jgi:pectate lyase